MWELPFCFFICSFLYFFTCFFLYLLISYFLYFLFLPFFIFYFFALSLCHSFYFFSIFLQPEPKLFHVTWANKLHWHFIFYMVCNGKSKQHRQIRCSGVFWLCRCFDNAWQNPVKCVPDKLGPLRTLIWNMPVRRTTHEYFVLGSHRYVLLAFK